MSKHIYGVGETVYDILFRNEKPLKAVPGGSAFNAIISLGRCGLRPIMSTFVGDDAIGTLTLGFMNRNGVDTGCVERLQGCRSHLSLAFLNDRNDAEYQFYKDHASLSMTLPVPAFGAEDYVLFGSFFAVNPAIREQVFRYLSAARTAGTLLYYDINFRPTHVKDLPFVRENLLENLRLASVVRGSMEDFHYLFGIDDASSDRFSLAEDVYHQHIKVHCPYLLVTDGGKAVHVMTPTLHEVFEVPPIKTVSTVGAGDNFNAGFLYSLYKNGVRHTALADISKEMWAQHIGIARRFAANVCGSLDNYVGDDFAGLLRDEAKNAG